MARPNWGAIIAHLERYLRHIDIAAHVERSEGWVGMVKRGVIRQPTYEQGVLLIELAMQYGWTQDTPVGLRRGA